MYIIKIKKINSINAKFSPMFILGSIVFNASSLIKVTTKTVKDENIDDKDEYFIDYSDIISARVKISFD